MKNLEEYLTLAKQVERAPLSEVFDLVFNMIDKYTGPEKNHKAKVMGWKTSYKEGLSTEMMIRKKLLGLVGGVAQEEKVIKY
jgi:hypothetical protein